MADNPEEMPPTEKPIAEPPPAGEEGEAPADAGAEGDAPADEAAPPADAEHSAAPVVEVSQLSTQKSHKKLGSKKLVAMNSEATVVTKRKPRGQVKRRTCWAACPWYSCC